MISNFIDWSRLDMRRKDREITDKTAIAEFIAKKC